MKEFALKQIFRLCRRQYIVSTTRPSAAGHRQDATDRVETLSDGGNSTSPGSALHTQQPEIKSHLKRAGIFR